MGLFDFLAENPTGLNKAQNSLDYLRAADIPEGEAATGSALGYDLGILSGNPTEQTEAIAPELNAASAQTQAEKQRLSSEGTSRGGGVNAKMQQVGDIPTKVAVDSLTALQPGAAAATAGIGAGLTAAGTQAAEAEAANSLQKRAQNLAMVKALMDQIKLPTGSGAPAPTIPDAGGGLQPTDLNPPPGSEGGVLGVPPGTFGSSGSDALTDILGGY